MGKYGCGIESTTLKSRRFVEKQKGHLCGTRQADSHLWWGPAHHPRELSQVAG